jgi:hypothetical protein
MADCSPPCAASVEDRAVVVVVVVSLTRKKVGVCDARHEESLPVTLTAKIFVLDDLPIRDGVLSPRCGFNIHCMLVGDALDTVRTVVCRACYCVHGPKGSGEALWKDAPRSTREAIR